MYFLIKDTIQYNEVVSLFHTYKEKYKCIRQIFLLNVVRYVTDVLNFIYIIIVHIQNATGLGFNRKRYNVFSSLQNTINEAKHFIKKKQ